MSRRSLEDAETLDGASRVSSFQATRTAQLLAGRYELAALVGTGGMGSVYRAHDRELDEIVALKVLKRDLVESPVALERFRAEVKLTRRITHPNVVRTFDIGEHEGERFLTMEYVEGASLGALLEERGALEAGEAVRIAVAMAAGLGAAHSVGVVHRDLKPDNVLLASHGRVVVTDFGIARLISEVAASRTGTHQLLGTPLYMAPEQVEGARVDGRADVYALGLVLYEMLVGAPAWSGETLLALAAQRLVRPPPDPRDARPSIPGALADLVVRCMARDPSARPDAQALSMELTHVASALAAAPVVAPPQRAERALAVMSLRAPAELRTLADGLAIDLVNALASMQGVKVRAHPSDAADADPRVLGRELGVQAVVAGDIEQAGDGEVSIALTLFSVADGLQLWSARFRGPMSDLLGANDDAVAAIARALDSLSSAQPRTSGNPVAVQLYLRWRAEIARPIAPPRDAIALLERAYRLDPDNPAIVAEMAMLPVRSGALQAPTPDEQAESRMLVERAMKLNPRAPEPWVALARMHYQANDAAAALGALLTAVSHAPSCAIAHDLIARIMAEVDELDAALHHADRAVWLDPALHFARLDRVRALAFRGAWDAAEAELLELRTRAPVIHYLTAVRFSTWAGRAVTEPDEPPADTVMVPHGVAFWRAFHARRFGPEEREWLATAPWPAPPRGDRLRGQMTAELAAWAGDEDAALEGVREAVTAGLEDLAWMRRCAVLDPLRGRHAFVELLGEVERRAAPIARAYRSGIG